MQLFVKGYGPVALENDLIVVFALVPLLQICSQRGSFALRFCLSTEAVKKNLANLTLCSSHSVWLKATHSSSSGWGYRRKKSSKRNPLKGLNSGTP